METLTAATIRIPGSEALGGGINPFGDFNKSESVGVICDTSAHEVELEVGGKNYYTSKSVKFEHDTSTYEVKEAFTSREEYQRSIESQLKVEAKYGLFSGSFEATFGSDYSSLSERAAALITFSTTLWTLRLIDRTPTEQFKKDLAALPSQFTEQNALAFYNFIRSYGAYVVTAVTVGGSLDYAMLVDRNTTTSKETLKAKVTAEYGVMFKGSASQSQKEEVKNFKSHRTSRLTTHGGDATALARVDTENPDDNKNLFDAWKATIPAVPGIVARELVRLDAFAGTKAAAVSSALDKYLGGTLLVEADWISSSVVLSGAQVNAAASDAPLLRTVLVDKTTLHMDEKTFQAPATGADDGQFAAFWSSVQTYLNAAKPNEKMLVLATERWPRLPNFCPTPGVREALLRHGATEATLNRWNILTRSAVPCPIAGMSYVLAGDEGRNRGADALAVGFGNPERSLRPHARVSVLLPRNPTTGRVRVLPDDKPLEQSNTEFYMIQSHNGNGMLTVDPAGTRRVIVKAQDATQPEQFWYLHSGPSRYGWQPYAFVNYATCAMMAGKRGGGESDATRWDGAMNDDVLWDVRGGENDTHMLMLHWNSENWCLTNVGGSASVRPWHTDGMHWRRIKSIPA